MLTRDTTINPDELNFYESLSAFWWDRGGPFWPLHYLNELRVAWILEQCCSHFGRDPQSARPLKGLRAIDIGCGGGILSESISKLGAEVKGIDVVAKNLRIATLHAQDQGLSIEYEHRTVEDEVKSGAVYDLVFNMEVVEHVANLPAFMASSVSLSGPNGAMFIATINRTLLAWLFAIIGAENVLRWLPKGTHRWSDFRQPSELVNLLAINGLNIHARTGVAVNPLTRRFRLTRNMKVNYMLMAIREGIGG